MIRQFYSCIFERNFILTVLCCIHNNFYYIVVGRYYFGRDGRQGTENHWDTRSVWLVFGSFVDSIEGEGVKGYELFVTPND